MTTNKSKLRRERKKGKESTIPEDAAKSAPLVKGWVIRLAMMIPPALYACYLIWDLNNP